LLVIILHSTHSQHHFICVHRCTHTLSHDVFAICYFLCIKMQVRKRKENLKLQLECHCEYLHIIASEQQKNASTRSECGKQAYPALVCVLHAYFSIHARLAPEHIQKWLSRHFTNQLSRGSQIVATICRLQYLKMAVGGQI
jgi:hypothetical protein